MPGGAVVGGYLRQTRDVLCRVEGTKTRVDSQPQHSCTPPISSILFIRRPPSRSTPPPPSPPQTYNISNQLSARLFAYTNLAEYLALKDNAKSADPANKTAVVTVAAHDVLTGLFPFRGTAFDKVAIDTLAGLPPAELAKAKEVAGPVAAAALSAAAADCVGALEPYTSFWAPADGKADGKYRKAHDTTNSIYPQLRLARGLSPAGSATWAKDNLAKFYDKPFSLNSTTYADAVAHVKAIGAKESSTRLAYETETAKFWADGNGTPAITGHYYDIAASLLPADATLEQTAELFARIGVAQWDASIDAWDVKHSVLWWRPVTALRTDGGAGPGGSGDANWTGLLATPAHPEYPSGHSVSAGAAAAVLADWFGSDNVTFATNTVAPGFAPRTFTSLRESVDEVGRSRVYGGVHFQKAVDDGRDLGFAVANATQDAFDKGTVGFGKGGGAASA